MYKKPQLFGTDGVRGVAGRYPLDHETVAGLGWAIAGVLSGGAIPQRPQILLGQDTRESGPWIARALAGGMRTAGAEIAFAGVITTPGLAFLTRHYSFSAGVMVSASHNPFEDNGIKILSSSGTKLPESTELEIEEQLRRAGSCAERLREVDLFPEPSLAEPYLKFLTSTLPPGCPVSRYRLVADCGHGSASEIAPRLFHRLGIQAHIMNADPNGRNINSEAGSLHPQKMAAEACATGADLGVAFDGDADRSIFATPAGRVCDGDHVLFLMAPFRQSRGRLKGSAVVGTLMTNFRLELALKSAGIALKRTPVGDKFVLDEMLRSGLELGGEPSGHIIFSDISLAGDGLVTLLQMLQLLAETGQSMDDLTRDFVPFPQLILNVQVREKPPLESVPLVAHAVARCREDLGELGRVVLRYSGTEPLARIMVEGEDAARVEYHAAQLAAAIQSSLGGNPE